MSTGVVMAGREIVVAVVADDDLAATLLLMLTGDGCRDRMINITKRIETYPNFTMYLRLATFQNGILPVKGCMACEN
jgi:hypothetical protein